MKREFAIVAAEQNHHHHNKFQQLQSHTSSPPQYPPTSEDSHSHSPKRPNNSASDFQLPPPPPSNDGSTIEVSRRSRGRPPGSKNRPKPPVHFVARDPSSEPSMTAHVLHVPAGVDLVETTARFSRSKGAGLCFLSGNGFVTNVTLRQPSSTTGVPPLAFRGQFEILHITGYVFPSGGGGFPPNAPLAVSLMSPQGQLLGGLVAGPLFSTGNVYIVVATLNSPRLERLQMDDQEDARDGERESPLSLTAGNIGGAPIYSYQPADVVWAPSARLPQSSSAPPY